MLVLSYGITKSGSTLAFELAKAILEHAGHEQTLLPDGVVEPGHKVNFITNTNPVEFDKLINAIPDDKMVVVKSHTGFPPPLVLDLNERVSAGAMKVHAIYRDPREVCLSLLDAGRQARERNRKAFSEIHTLEQAVPNVQAQIRNFLRWASVDGALRLYYNDTAFDMEATVARMAEHLGVDTDPPLICKIVTENAFTQRNVARQDRYKDELTVRENETLMAEFDAFIKNACLEQNDAYFERQRERWLRIAKENK